MSSFYVIQFLLRLHIFAYNIAWVYMCLCVVGRAEAAAMEERSVLTLPELVLNRLTQNLEIQSALCKDWKGLAGVVGYNGRHTAFIESLRCGSSKTCLLLTEWDCSGESSIRKLVLALYYLERIDCIRILQPKLPDLNFPELKKQAAVMRQNDSELRRVFPLFPDDYSFSFDKWPSSHQWSLPDQPQLMSQVRTRDSVDREELAGAVPAYSPEEEAPSFSANPSQAIGVTPAKDKVFISYFPDSSSRSWVRKLAEDVAVIDGLTVAYANERQMMDMEYKTSAISSSDNIVVFLTPRYCSEYERLDNDQSLSSSIKVDRKMIKDIFFSDTRRLILVALDQDSHSQCVPSLYRGLRLYRYPSQLRDFRHCIADVPQFVAPQPEKRFSVEPIKISFTADVKEFSARHNLPLPLSLDSSMLSHRSSHPPPPPPPTSTRHHPQAMRIVPAQFPGRKKSFLGKMFNKKR